MITESRSAEVADSIALEIAGEEPTIRPSLLKAEILKALKEAGSLEDRDSIKMRVLASLRAEPRRREDRLL